MSAPWFLVVGRVRPSPAETLLIEPSGGIEVGAVGADLRLWLAKEALRQGEARLTAQAAIRTALEARATALTGWAAVGLLAATGAVFTARDGAGQWGAGVAGYVLFVAAGVGIHAARPRAWSIVGYDPLVILNDPLASELEAMESTAGGLSDGIQANNTRLDSMGRFLRMAGWLLILAPLFGAAAFRFAPQLTSWSAVALQLFRSGPV